MLFAGIVRSSDFLNRWLPPLFLFFCALSIILLIVHHERRRRALSRLACRLGLEYRPTLSDDWFSLKSASFYKVGSTFRNYLRGSIAGRDTFIVDHQTWSGPDYEPTGEVRVDQTIIAFRAPADTTCRERGVLQPDVYNWRVEKIGEWIFVFQPGILVRPEKMEAFIEDARTHFESAINPASYEITQRSPSRY